MKKVLYLLALICLLFCSCDLFAPQEGNCEHYFVTKTEGGKVCVDDGVVSYGSACTVTKTCLKCGLVEIGEEAPTLTLDYSDPGYVYYLENEDAETSIVIPQYVSYDDGEDVEITCISDFYTTGGSMYHSIKSVLINESITTIDDDCFRSCYMLEDICIPSNASVGNNAFKNCYALRNLYFNGKVDIGTASFSTCYALKNVYPNSAVENNLSSFDSCYIILEGIDQ